MVQLRVLSHGLNVWHCSLQLLIILLQWDAAKTKSLSYNHDPTVQVSEGRCNLVCTT